MSHIHTGPCSGLPLGLYAWSDEQNFKRQTMVLYENVLYEAVKPSGPLRPTV